MKYNKEIWIQQLKKWEVVGVATLTDEEVEILNESSKTVRFVEDKPKATKDKK